MMKTPPLRLFALTLIVTVPAVDAALIGHWTFDEGEGTTTADVSSNGNTATQAGTAGSWETGAVGGGYQLGGNNSRFEVADSSDLRLTGAVTVSAWVKPFGASQFGVIAGVDQVGGTANDMYSLKTTNSAGDGLNWLVVGPGTNVNLVSSSTLDELSNGGADWVHVAGVYDPSGFAALYVNGVLDVSTTTVPSSIQSRTTPFQIGHNAGNSGNNALQAAVDDIRVYDEALDAAQISLLYSGSGGLALRVARSGADDLEFSWVSTAGKVYDLLSSTDPETDGDPDTWAVVTGQEGIAAIPPSNTLTIERPADAMRLYAVRERDAPPLFSDDFESVQNWTTGANTGDTGNTVWERGAPVADLGSGATGPATGANGSVNCYGTNIDAIYGSDTDIYLRSPEINLTSLDSGNTATLTLQYFIDTDLATVDPDVGRIRVLNANNLSEQLGTDLTGSDGLGSIGSNWTPFSEPLPAEALGETVVLEFQFTSNSDTDNFGGFYIDDVEVSVE